MPSENYSFLDVAVLDEVRTRFAAGDALLILSADLDQVLWANGPGAAVLGHADIEAAIDAPADLPPVAKRQITATAGFPAIGRNRALLVRLSRGMATQAIGFQASAVTMPDGEAAILLSVPAQQTGSRSVAEIAERAISGFTTDGQFLAFIDGSGNVEAASEGFSGLGISTETLGALAGETGRDHERTLKRRVQAGRRALPAGMARLTDDPERHLLVVIDDGSVDRDETAPAATTSAGNAPTASVEPAAAEGWRAADDSASTSAPSGEQHHDGWYFSDAGRNGENQAPTELEPTEAAATARPAIVRNAAPVRFVWRTDEAGRFSAISPEFAAVVGDAAADVIGRRFKDVATTFGFDPSGEIAGLLDRRDTWSGRSVAWPIAGSSLKVPVDLAALPVYDRNRNFEGFRGFGVARVADATEDHEKVGEALTPDWTPSETPPAPVAAPPAASEAKQPSTESNRHNPFHGETPALTIAPTPERRFTDKVIRLAEHRAPANDKGLSNVERTAFREIGERLKKDSAAETGKAAPATPKETIPAAPQTDVAAASPDKVETTVASGADIELAKPADAVAPITPQKPEAEVQPAVVTAEQPAQDNRADAAEPEAAGAQDDAVSHDETAVDDSTPLVEAQEAEDIEDLARLDGVDAETVSEIEDSVTSSELPVALSSQPVEAEAAGSDDAAQPAANPAAPRSLLAFATPDEGEADDRTAPTLDDAGDVRAAAAKATQQRRGVVPEETPSAEDAVEDADLARLEDDGDLAHPRDEHEAPSAAEPTQVTVTPRAAPPLQAGGFVPAAFSTGETAPDTSLVARLPVPLLIHSGDRLHYANTEFLALTGYGDLAALEAAGGLDALFADAYASDDAPDHSDHKLRLRKAGGDEVPVDAVLRSVPWGKGKALMLVLNGTTDTRSAQVLPFPAAETTQPDNAELKARIAEMRTIIDTATDGVVLINRDGTIRSISRPAEALFGFDSDDVAGKQFASLFAIESQKAARDYLAGLSDNGVASVLNDGREVIGREAEGRFIPLFMTIGRLPGDSGYCAVVRDITQWKRAEEELTQARAVAERASSQKTDFLARISHEIRTPLNAIIGFSELMVDEKFGPVANERYRDYLRDINRSGNHVLDLVNDLLDISKIEAGQQEMDYEAVSLNDTLAESVALMQPQANRERVIIRSSFASRLPEVVADLRSIRQIALNILSNAVRYTQAGGQVIVSTAYETSGDVVMRVRDTGVGMSQAEIEHALKPFKQVNALKRGRSDGTGLGLPLTKAMVEANRARFTINSTPGEGTLVEVAFPSTRVLAD
ncbi:MAG TPA: histidine kinase dimerization/phospho-acceptor domain-containing protein [Mesorhizobium sp.]|jgi:PAS domain S-box-containing protein|uniref:PAS domain-containing sensor histidine kinase n=1 Tax=Mesorhizobium sp. TaxID=1871066 RepID=UPI002DDD6988|nr:histidine kinase dimerization/phospho-acceptor domain-containing protein [Mesorhizobium sp.]HEV2505731.1 histidine kinase dimerization/phospho-acceptor domain-containing protein [Mesorhizobium sp.]